MEYNQLQKYQLYLLKKKTVDRQSNLNAYEQGPPHHRNLNYLYIGQLSVLKAGILVLLGGCIGCNSLNLKTYL